jgi:hypothetical protein
VKKRSRSSRETSGFESSTFRTVAVREPSHIRAMAPRSQGESRRRGLDAATTGTATARAAATTTAASLGDLGITGNGSDGGHGGEGQQGATQERTTITIHVPTPLNT